MMKQFWTIFNFELKNYYKSKSFVGVTLALVLILAVVLFFPRLKETFVGENETETNDTEKSGIMYVLSDDETLSAVYSQAFSEAFADYEVKNGDKTLDEVKEMITSNEVECAFVIESPTEYTYYVNNLSMYDDKSVIADSVMQNMFRINSMVGSGLSPEDATTILSTPISHEVESLGVDQMQNYFYAYMMIIALYVVILLYGQMVTMSVATEKSSRAMELLITSAKPANMMFGKVFAACLAGFSQLAVIFGSVLVFYNINRDYWSGFEMADMFFDIPPELLVYMMIFFVLGFLVYAFLFGAVGSTVSKLEEVNTAISPIMYIFVAMYILVIIALTSGEVDTVLMKVCSFIPLTSPMAMFTRIALSTVPLHEIIISIVLLVVSVFGIGFISAKIYRVGVLLYGTPPKIGAIIKAMRKA